MTTSGNSEARALLAVRVTVLVPVLWFLLAGLIGKIAGKEWVPIDAWAWPLMVAPLALAGILIKFRQAFHHPQREFSLPTLLKVGAGLLLVANIGLIFYSWLASVPLLLCAAILLEGLFKRPRKETV